MKNFLTLSLIFLLTSTCYATRIEEKEGIIGIGDITYLKLDGSNADSDIDIGGYDFSTTGIGTFGSVAIGASGLQFEGSTANDYETTVNVVDPTLSDKTINFPNASGTVAVSATAPITLSALGDISHSTANGNVHTPADGASTQLLQYSSAGTSKWITMSTDASIADGGAVTVADDSHAHTGTTLSGIDISADTNLTAGDALTITDDDIDFDGGASPGGELGNTWASPTIDDTLAVTNWTLTTPDITGVIDLKNADTSAGSIAIYEDSDDGVNKTTITVPAMVGDINYTLPADDGDAGEQLQTNGAGVLTWEAAGGAASVAWDDIGDPDADATIAFGGYEEDITSTLDEASHTILTITNTDADRANDTTILGLADNDQGDANVIWTQFTSDADGTPDVDFQIGQTATAMAAQINLGATGVLIYDDADGALTIKGNSAGADEDLTINLDDTADEAVVSSSTAVGTIDFGTINLETDVFEADTALQTGADPADTGALRLSNAEIIAWEDATECTLTHVDNVGLLLNLELEIDGTLDADGIVALGDGGDNFSVASDGIDIATNGDITNAGTVGCGAITSTGVFASLDIPAIGNDPDVATAGYIGRDNNDHSLRGYDGSVQYVYGQKIKQLDFVIANPDLLTEAAFLPLWTNKSGFTFNITAVYSVSDVDNAVYTLKYTTNSDTDHSALTTIEAITIATDGTGVFYNDLEANIDDTTVENDKTIGFDAGATDCDFIKVTIVGYFNGDVS